MTTQLLYIVRWWDNKRRCGTANEGRTSSQVVFSIYHMAGVFIVGGFGLACSVSFFLFKKFYLLANKDSKKTDRKSIENHIIGPKNNDTKKNAKVSFV